MAQRVWIAILLSSFALSLLGGWTSYRRVAHDARALRICRIARDLAAEYHQFRTYAEEVPDDDIVMRLMAQDLFQTHLRQHQRILQALRQEAPEEVPPWLGIHPDEPFFDPHELAADMAAWEIELATRFQCPRPLLPQKYMDRYFRTRSGVRANGLSLAKSFTPALKRSREIAAQYWQDVRNDTDTLCRSREALAKANVIHNYLEKRCRSTNGGRSATFDCATPIRRSSDQLAELRTVVAINEAKFKEKWSPWLKSVEVNCQNDATQTQ